MAVGGPKPPQFRDGSGKTGPEVSLMDIMQCQPLVVCDDDILGGVPVFAGTRVPVQTLFDYLKTNHLLADFLDDFPTVGRQQAEAVLEMSQQQCQHAPREAAARRVPAAPDQSSYNSRRHSNA